MKNNRPGKPFILFRLVAALLGIIVIIMIPPLILAVITGEGPMIRAFLIPMGCILSLAAPCFFSLRKRELKLNAKDGFLLVFLTWSFASVLGAIPFYLSQSGISFTDALFESACTFATTGGTTFEDVEALPRALLFWRSLAHWFGGMGIILLTVALMPLLGIGGFQLIKAETPGPEKEKITPKITVTAKILWLAYCVLTLILFGLYLLGGMGWFDALCHSLTTMASGGVSTRNAGIAFFHSPFIEGVSTVFMLLTAINFNIYYRLLRGKFRDIAANTELRVYLGIFFVAAAAVTVSLIPVYGSPLEALRYASYQTASILSTTGSAVTDYEQWPGLARMVLFILMFIGGCSGSTAGGLKVIRHAVLWKQMGNVLRRTLYPRGVFSIQLNKRVGRKDVIYGVAGFFCLYLMVVAATTIITAAAGTDLFSAFSAALSITGNVGVGFGAVGPAHNYSAFPNHIKWLFSFMMIAGRLELWTVFLLFRPIYWRH
ncbi:MAG: TrkH family potassium uptake protein [Treponema sp.]|jgi:trk system potassium uptake protein TrkH|nr:TrkH family potassium uptake protein [Treponema sp.]